MNNQIFTFIKLLNKEEIEFLKENITPISFEKDTILFYQEDICKDILLLEEGEISLYIYGDIYNESVSLYNIGPGEQCIINTASKMI